ncbi:DEK1 [Acrasis kona]|uniref:DEK1 n=1 Tax=Acrasis kona TaxID=1008807 RepID=A0AAW2YR81_9EUKA
MQTLYVDTEFPPSKWDLPEGKEFMAVRPSGKLIVGGAKRSDPRQGQIGDCYLIAALSMFFEDKDLEKVIHNLVQYDKGKVTLKFGGQLVVTDSFLPYDKARLELLYGGSTNVEELYVSFIEKAYAKHMGGYNKIIGGRSEEFLRSLFGGRCHVVENIQRYKFKVIQDAIMKYISEGFKVCLNAPRDDSRHAYSICIMEGKILLRNPWAKDDLHDRTDGINDGEYELEKKHIYVPYPSKSVHLGLWRQY